MHEGHFRVIDNTELGYHYIITYFFEKSKMLDGEVKFGGKKKCMLQCKVYLTVGFCFREKKKYEA